MNGQIPERSFLVQFTTRPTAVVNSWAACIIPPFDLFKTERDGILCWLGAVAWSMWMFSGQRKHCERNGQRSGTLNNCFAKRGLCESQSTASARFRCSRGIDHGSTSKDRSYPE